MSYSLKLPPSLSPPLIKMIMMTMMTMSAAEIIGLARQQLNAARKSVSWVTVLRRRDASICYRPTRHRRGTQACQSRLCRNQPWRSAWQTDRQTDRSQDLHDALIRSLACLLLVAAAPKTGTLHTIMAQYWQASQTLPIYGISGRKKEDKQPDYTPIRGIPLYEYTRALLHMIHFVLFK